MKLKKTLIFIFFILMGIILGSLVASLCSDIPFLSWLSFGKSIGIYADKPFVLDLAVAKISFGFEMGINVAQIIFIMLSLLAYHSFGKKI